MELITYNGKVLLIPIPITLNEHYGKQELRGTRKCSSKYTLRLNHTEHGQSSSFLNMTM